MKKANELGHKDLESYQEFMTAAALYSWEEYKSADKKEDVLDKFLSLIATSGMVVSIYLETSTQANLHLTKDGVITKKLRFYGTDFTEKGLSDLCFSVERSCLNDMNGKDYFLYEQSRGIKEALSVSVLTDNLIAAVKAASLTRRGGTITIPVAEAAEKAALVVQVYVNAYGEAQYTLDGFKKALHKACYKLIPKGGNERARSRIVIEETKASLLTSVKLPGKTGGIDEMSEAASEAADIWNSNYYHNTMSKDRVNLFTIGCTADRTMKFQTDLVRW